MKYVNGDVYFKSGNKEVYPYLNYDIKTDVAIIGGGFSGLITAYFLSESEKNVTVFEKNIIGYGLSFGIKGLIKIDYMNLVYKKKKEEITRLYELYLSSKEKLKKILEETNTKYFELDRYMYVNKMMQKNNLQKNIDFMDSVFNVKGEIIENIYEVNSTLLAKFDDKVISFNSNQFINNLAKYLVEKRNVEIYENTNIIDVEPTYEKVFLITNNDFKVEASKVIYASGMDILKTVNVNITTFEKFNILLDKNEELKGKKKYLENFNEEGQNIVFKESGCLDISGEDIKVNMKMMDLRYKESLEKEKYAKMVVWVNKLVDKGEYKNRGRCYSSIYGKTFDMLPIIDEIECMPNCFVVASFGTNTILNAVIAGGILKNAVNGLFTKEIRFFKLNREGCINK